MDLYSRGRQARFSRWPYAVASLATAITVLPLTPLVYRFITGAFRHCTQTVEENTELTKRITQSEEALEESKARYQVLFETLLQAEDKNRERLAYEIHDGLTQTASGCHQKIQAFIFSYRSKILAGKMTIEDLRAWDIHLDRIEEMARQTVIDCRFLIDEQRPPILDDYGLADAIEQKIDTLRKEGWNIGYNVHLPESGYEQRASSEAETVLWRVVSEALKNIEKHSGATKVLVTLDLEAVYDSTPIARLQITDNGRGFDPQRSKEPAGPGEHNGLNSIKYRVNFLQGRLQVHSAPGKGTTILAEIPYVEEEKWTQSE